MVDNNREMQATGMSPLNFTMVMDINCKCSPHGSKNSFLASNERENEQRVKKRLIT